MYTKYLCNHSDTHTHTKPYIHPLHWFYQKHKPTDPLTSGHEKVYKGEDEVRERERPAKLLTE